MSGPNDNFDPKQVAALDASAIERYVHDALEAIAAATSTAELKRARHDHAGDTSPLALANREIGALPPQARKEAGRRVGEARGTVSRALSERQDEVAAAELEASLVVERVDMTLPVTLRPQGALHPVTTLIDEMIDVFVAMGWEVADGPELEAEWYNFDALNLGPDHPARALQDTLWVDPPSGGKLMRTQTSPVQARALLEYGVPLYVISPGKVFRADEYDATHLPVFHQLEGLVVDRGISMADLRGTLDHLARAMFGDVRTRMRPHYFPFTEPSAEVDLECFVCHGASVGNPDAPCRTCKSEGWIEWGGCGVVNPRVLRACGVDPDVYSGFAFGMGVDRTVMFRTGAPDLRDFVEGDIRFSRSILGGSR
ncbi:phenylalanine--tRNA ligase subunit alpha [Tessaracoccus flavus]|uniref:Phenylalanine--tRNA ligase alpha subunit n=1 Tax=Tessaracoccus flavus TaxID=1610493 RepID=A0A1Q2CF91_9ACTN|nr:phenylalanine--tRNA ligase subunit alpha [Tessaracoccus flavus]AQP44792.1 phenylalanine--tRNA ligase subunit alpha [Tessaracoccus flavus]SDZ19470.1 phenylalanyl-tRNA synthetase, alpha subunit [Tessaracoccus flavus]